MNKNVSGFLLCAACAALASCAQISTNARTSSERRPQANDPVTGGASLAMTAFRATAVAAVRQPVTTAKLGITLVWHRPREVIVSSIPVDLALGPVPEEKPGTPEFERMLDSAGFPEAESGRLSWLVGGKEFFPELDRRIDSARETIDVQVFIFDNDDIAVRYADKLKKRAGDSRVRVLYDDLGSTYAGISPPETPGPEGFVPPQDIGRYLEQGSELNARRTLNPWLVCDHTKLLVFDRQTALLGGMNIGREYYSEWHDLMARVDGPIVGTMQKDFNRAWRKAGFAGDFAILQPPKIFGKPRPLADGVPLRILRTDAAAGRHEILKSTLLAIRAARKRIWIQIPYFSHDEISLALASAARRGVDVRVILPERGDSTIMDAANLNTARRLIEAGGKVYRYPGMTHMKAMLFDGWGSFGSANLDFLSMRVNRELNLGFSDRATVAELERRVFLPDFRKSGRMTLKETEVRAAQLVDVLAGQL